MNHLLLRNVSRKLLAAATFTVLFGAMLPLAAQAQAASATRSDGQIEMDVVHDLDASQALQNDLITAATVQAEVTLAGTVSSEASRELAEMIASRVAGVTKVNNNLKVGDPQAADNAADAGAQQQADNQQGSADNTSSATSDPASSQSQAQTAPGVNDGPLPAPPAQTQAQAQAPPPPVGRPQYAPGRRMMRVYAPPSGPVTVPQGTLLMLRTSEPVGTRHATDGTPVQFTVIQDVAVNGVLAIPRGATVHGVVTESKKAGELSGSSELALKLTSLDLGGQSYPLVTDQFKVKGPNKAGETAAHAFGGALLGAIIGGAVGRGPGAAIGAGAGAVAGTATSAASPGPNVWIPAEARVDFHLNTPLTVTPVDAQEAARLSQGLYSGGPTLYQRGYYPYGRPYYAAAGYPYGYPPVFYRPYYVVGGYYYWR